MTTAQRSTAAGLISRKGQSVTLTRRASGTYSVSTGSATVTETTQSGKGVILPFGVGLRKQSGTDILASDRQCLLSALKTDGTALTAPQVNDTLTDAASNKWTVVESSPLSPAGTDIFYDLIIRGAK